MTSRSALRPGDLLLSAALSLSGAASPSTAQPAPSVTVPASFDCGKATRAVDRFICANAALRWQDLALSRSYRAVLDSLTRSEEHTSELQSLMRNSYAVFRLKKKNQATTSPPTYTHT